MNGAAPQDDLAGGVTLDGLFRANAATRPDAIAVIDPPDRGNFTDGAPQRLTYAEMDMRVDTVARALQALGLQPGSVVAIQLPNIVEGVISLLATLRAGYVAAPVPVLWRRSDLVTSLSGIAPHASITVARLGDERLAEVFCEAAAELFDLSFPCAFGAEVPDGVIPLDRLPAAVAAPPAHFPSPSGDVSIVTFDAHAEGFFATGRSDPQWLAAGLAVLLEARIENGAAIMTTLPFNTLAGIGAAFVPWLLSGGTLQLVHGGPPVDFAPTHNGKQAHLVAPAAAFSAVERNWAASLASCIAVHRLPATHDLDLSGLSVDRVIDLYNFGETGMVPLVRDDLRRGRPVPLGPVSVPSGAVSAPVVIETRLASGELCLRGPMVPRESYPAGQEWFRRTLDGDGFVRSGFRCHSDGNGGLLVDSGPERVVSVGGLRFGLDDLRSRFSACLGSINLTAIEDPLLGQRLHIEAEDREAAASALLAAGHSRIVVEAAMGSGKRGRIA